MRDKEARVRIIELEERISKLENEMYIPLDTWGWRWFAVGPKISLLKAIGLILDYLKLELIHTEKEETIKLKKVKKDKCK